MRKDEVKLSNLGIIPAIGYAGSFDGHMVSGNQAGQSHTGLHLTVNMRKGPANNQVLAAGDANVGTVTASRMTVPNRAYSMKVLAKDARAATFRASVIIYGQPKISTFFPIGTTLLQAKAYIQEAWTDHCTYGSSDHGGGDVDIYSQMRAAFGMNWVGQATINAQKIWVGSALAGPLVTAFPAVNNKFG